EDEREKDKVSLQSIVRMEQYFGVSRSALLNRLQFIDLISKEKKESLKSNIRRSAFELGYRSDLYESGNCNKVIGDYGERAKRLFDKELVTETDFFSLMLDIGIDLDQQIEDDEKAAG
ncbi:MAG: hypothetical protein QM664_06650, partial [Flavihumibacter sp.]